MKRLSLLMIGLFALNSWAADLTQEMDALGANKDLMKKARAIDPNNKVRVVQNRQVDRHNRLEFGLNYGMNASGGDPYVNTTMLGGQMDFHINPRWSLGARYENFQNKLSSEGRSVYDDAQRRIANNEQGVRVPGIAYAKDSWLAVGNWYPIYGKMNLFDAGIAQFDIYFLGGAGQINMAYGSEALYTAGAGVGFWLAQHVSTRLEARWQGYKEKIYDGADISNRNMNETVLQATIGFIL